MQTTGTPAPLGHSFLCSWIYSTNTDLAPAELCPGPGAGNPHGRGRAQFLPPRVPQSVRRRHLDKVGASALSTHPPCFFCSLRPRFPRGNQPHLDSCHLAAVIHTGTDGRTERLKSTDHTPGPWVRKGPLTLSVGVRLTWLRFGATGSTQLPLGAYDKDPKGESGAEWRRSWDPDISP